MSKATPRVVERARKIQAAAPGYKTQAACAAAITRIQRLWRADGSYGCMVDAVRDAIQECQMRWLELQGQQWDAANAT
jgi:hypothetical protein